ncbi:MAG: YfhO family protein [Gemmatimonadota bacterium]
MMKASRIPTWIWFSLVAGIITAWLYRSFLLDGDVMLYGREMITQAYQLRQFGVTEIQSGRGFPLWNPYVFGGLPYLAILPGPVFYPTSLLYLLMPLYRAIGWTFVIHTMLAGVSAYAAARTLKLDRWSSAITGFSFMLTGFVMSMLHEGHDGRMFTMVLIPLAFAFLEKGLTSHKLGWFLGMGLVVALQIFTPHVQLMYFSSLALSLYAVIRIAGMARADGRTALRVGLYLGVGFMSAAAIGAVQLLPTFQILDIVVRGGGETGYAFASSWAMPVQELSAVFLPDLIGSLGTYWGSNPFKHHTEYVGVVPAALALIGLTLVRRDRRVALLAGLAALCLLFALGSATPVHRLAYDILPLIRRLRAPSMMMGPAAFFISLLAGFGWQRVLDARRSGESLPWAWIVGLSTPALVLGLAAALDPNGLVHWVHTSWFPVGWPKRPGLEELAILRASGTILVGVWLSVLFVAAGVAKRRLPELAIVALIALLVVDLGRVDSRYISTTTPREAFPSDPVVEHLAANLQLGARVFPLPERGGYGQNELMTFGIPVVTGNQNFRLKWADRLYGGLAYTNLLKPSIWPLLDLDYLLTSAPIETPLLAAETRGPKGTAWRVVDDRAHAWFPRRVEAAPDDATALQRILDRSTVDAFALVRILPETPLPTAGSGTVDLISFEPNELVFDVDVTDPGLLFISEIYHPAWKATVDGESVPVYQVDIAFRGVDVPEGRHEVRFSYSTDGFRTGMLISLLGLLVTISGIGVGLVSWLRHRDPEESGT